MSLHKGSGPPNSVAKTPGGPAVCLPRQSSDSGRGRSGLVHRKDYLGPRPSRICSEPEKVRTSSHTRSRVHRGQVLHRSGQTVPTRGTHPGTNHLCKILLQIRGIQTSSPIPELAVANGSNAAVDGICPLPHASHPVVHEAALDPHNPWVSSSDLCQQGSGPRTPLVVE